METNENKIKPVGIAFIKHDGRRWISADDLIAFLIQEPQSALRKNLIEYLIRARG